MGWKRRFTPEQCKSIAQNFREFRRTRFLTQIDLAEMLEVDPQTISNIENCCHEPLVHTYLRFTELMVAYPVPKDTVFAEGEKQQWPKEA